MKKIAIINQDSGYLMVDIANRFHDAGYETCILAGRLVERGNPLYEGIRVRKIIRYDRSSTTRRLVSWGLGTIQIFFTVLFKLRDFQLLIFSNPPFATLLPSILRNKFSLFIFDVFPDAMIEYGVLKRKSIVIKIWTKANQKIFKKANKVFTLTNDMQKLLSRYTDLEKIKIVPLWVNTEFLKPIPKEENVFSRNQDLEGKFVVLYSGNFGLGHSTEVILELASKVTDKRIIFILIGGGASEGLIRRKHSEMGLENCRILPWQEVNMLPFSLAAADLSIVTLNENAANLAIPSKLFSYLSVGSPIMSITSSGSVLERFVEKHQIGKSFRPDELNAMLEFIYDLINKHETNSYSENSLKASTLFTEKNVNIILDYYSIN